MAGKLQCQTQTKNKRRHARRRGQGLVEFALVAPLMIFMLLITVDFARAYSAYIEVSNAARAGAIFGARSAELANDDDAVRDAALLETPTIYGSAPTVTPDLDTDAGGYPRISVTVEYDFSPLIIFPGIPENIEISRTVQMRVIG